jgi:hypothetical protein
MYQKHIIQHIHIFLYTFLVLNCFTIIAEANLLLKKVMKTRCFREKLLGQLFIVDFSSENGIAHLVKVVSLPLTNTWGGGGEVDIMVHVRERADAHTQQRDT